MGGDVETRFANIGRREIRLVIFWLLVILVVVADQATKAAAVRVVQRDGAHVLIPYLVNLELVENTGAAFSIGQGATVLFLFIAIAFLVGAVLLVWREEDLPVGLVVPVAMVAGGGVGNMVDRLVKGSVTDFLSFSFVKFPVFNVADICVTVGVFLCAIGFWLWDARHPKESKSPLSPANDKGGIRL